MSRVSLSNSELDIYLMDFIFFLFSILFPATCINLFWKKSNYRLCMVIIVLVGNVKFDLFPNVSYIYNSNSFFFNFTHCDINLSFLYFLFYIFFAISQLSRFPTVSD